MPRYNNIQFRKGTSTEWTNSNSVLATGEPGYETDTGKLKIGINGSGWNNLYYTAIHPTGLLAGNNITIGLGSNGSSATISVTGSVEHAQSLITTVFNNTGASINKMTAVYINGGHGDRPTIQKAIATTDASSAGTYGLTYETIGINQEGKVIVFGALSGLNTDQFNPSAPQGNVNGTVLYLSPTVSGGLTSIKPYAPSHIVTIGTITRTHQTDGVIEVRIQNGYELEELHDVAVTGVTNGQFLQYNTASGLWVPTSSGNFTSLSINAVNVQTQLNSKQDDLSAPIISYTHPDNTYSNNYDVIIPNELIITRGSGGAIYNLAKENSWSYIFSPSGTVWNNDGWDNLTNVQSRTYHNLYTLWGEGNIGNLIVDSELIMNHIPSDRYWKVKFNSWTQGGAGGFSYTRQEVFNIQINSINDFIYITPTGSNNRLGINTQFPASQLHVVGNGIFSSGLSVSGLLTSNSGNFSGDLVVGGNLTVNGSVVTANVDRMEIEDPIITLGLASGNIVTTDTLDRGLALIRGTALTAFMGWDTSASQFVMLSSGVASNSSGIYTPGTYGNLRINDLVCNTGNFNGINVGGPARFSIGAGGFGFQIDRGNIDPGFNGDILKFDVNDSNGVGYSTTLMSDAPGYDIIVKLPADSGTLARLSDINTSQITGVLSVAKGGTNRSTYSNGQLLIGSGTSLAANTLTAGTGISITNGSGTITINSSIVNPVIGTGVANHIAYWNSASGIVADSGQLYWDATNNRLGIGTSSPGTTLDIRGSAVFNEDGANNDFRIEGDTDSNLFFLDASADRIGIGTNAPNAKLAISAGGAGGTILGAAQSQPFQINDATSSDYINLAHFNVTNAASRGSFTLSNNSSNAWENNVMQFFVHGTGYQHGYYGGNTSDAGCAMIVTQGSNVAKLQIGNISSVPIEFFTANSLALKIKADHDFDFYKEIYDANESGVVLKFHNKYDDVGELAAIAAGTDSSSYDAGKLRFFTGLANNISERMCINYVGSVGIGTSTPSVKLDVVGDVNIDGNLTFDSFTESVVSNGNSGTSKTLSLVSGTVHTCTLTGNCTFTMPATTAGKSFTMFLNTGSGNYTASFSGVRWADSATPTATILASKVDIYSFISDGSYWYGSFSQNYG